MQRHFTSFPGSLAGRIMYNTDFVNSHFLLPMQLKSRPDILLLGFITFSLLLHLLLFLLLPQHDLFPVPTRPAPVYVEMRPPKPAPPRQRELDLPVRPELEKPRETPAKRLGPADQVVKKEMAPKGQAPEDMRPEAPSPPKPSSRPAQTAVPQPAPTTGIDRSLDVAVIAEGVDRHRCHGFDRVGTDERFDIENVAILGVLGAGAGP